MFNICHQVKTWIIKIKFNKYEELFEGQRSKQNIWLASFSSDVRDAGFSSQGW